MSDPDAVERTYVEQKDRLLRAVFAFARSREIAEDAVAEAFAQAFRGADRIDDPAAWIWRTSFRLASRELGSRRSIVRHATEAEYEMDRAASSLMEALRTLSPSQRAAIVLHHYAGYCVREVAAIIGSTSGAVRVHLSVGRKRLRRTLDAMETLDA